MKKLEIYLDTSVIYYLDQQDSINEMQETLKFWKYVKNNEYKIYVSETTLLEIDGCNDNKKKILYKFLSEISYSIIEINVNVKIKCRKLLT